MSTLSPTTVAINTIAHCLANAMNASAGLDAAISEDLRALLRLAAGEADRVRKASRKAASAAKRATNKSESKSVKKASSKSAGKADVAAVSKPKARRKVELVNGLVAH